MKKALSILMILLMIISTMPVMAIHSSAAEVMGDWTTYRASDGYNPPPEGEDPSYTPAPGYEYTDDGFHMISPDYTNCPTYGTAQTKDPVDLDDGVYMEVRVDNFTYGGEDGKADNWVSFSIWNQQSLAQGHTSGYGQGWFSLNRFSNGTSDAGAIAQSFISGEPSTMTLVSQPQIDPKLDENGKEIFTFSVTKSGDNYIISICDVVVSSPAVTKHLKALNEHGEFYVGVSFCSSQTNGVVEATILKYGTSKEDASTPVGSDSKAPEANPVVIAELADSSTIEAGKPCLLFDANGSSWSGKLGVQGMTMDAMGNGAFRISPTEATGFHTWNIRKTMSYQAKDFPIVAFLIEDPNAIIEKGELQYSTGQYVMADGVHKVPFNIWDEANRSYGESGWTLFVLDMQKLLDEETYADAWVDRINSLRFDYLEMFLDTDAEKNTFNFHWAGIFRSVEEAYAYSDAYVITQDPDLVPETEESIETPSEAPSEEPTVTPSEETSATPSEETSDKPMEGTTTSPAGEVTQEQNNENDSKQDDTGCSSAVGSVAVLFAAIAAVIALKKKDRWVS